MNSPLRRLATALAVVIVGGLVTPAVALAQAGPAPSGGITLAPATGTDVTLLTGTTSGPCTAAGANGLQVWVTGPGPFAPDEAAGRPFGVALQAATPTGFSTSVANTFTSRAGFLDLARELGLSSVPTGSYVVDFRCVDLDFTTVYQTYRASLTFSTPTTYAVSGAAPAAPGAPAAGAAPAGSAPTGAGPLAPPPGAATGPAGTTPVGLTADSARPAGPDAALIVTITVAAVLAAAVTAYLTWRRRSRRVSPSGSRSS